MRKGRIPIGLLGLYRALLRTRPRDSGGGQLSWRCKDSPDGHGLRGGEGGMEGRCRGREASGRCFKSTSPPRTGLRGSTEGDVAAHEAARVEGGRRPSASDDIAGRGARRLRGRDRVVGRRWFCRGRGRVRERGRGGILCETGLRATMDTAARTAVGRHRVAGGKEGPASDEAMGPPRWTSPQ